MELQHIRYFVAVAQQRSFSKAAQQLFVTQPILTRCIKQLEQELGVALILRSTRTFELTDAGQELLQRGTELLQQHGDLYRRIGDVAAAQAGRVHISCPGVILDVYFPPLVTAFRQRYPGVRIEVRESGSREVVRDVRDGQADLGLVMLPLEESEGLTVHPLLCDEVRLAVPRGHRFERQGTVDIADLRDCEIITYNQSATLYHTFLQMCREEGFVPNIAYQSMMPSFILDTISYGHCVGVLPAPMLRRFAREDICSLPLSRPFAWDIAVITKQQRYLSHAAREFLSFATAFLPDIR